jgi:serine/threonine protein kinase
LLTSDWKVKLTDFGESRDFSNGSTDAERNGQVSDTKGTWAFWAPEMCMMTASSGDDYYSAYAADVWAAGVTLYAMLFGVLPFWGVDCDDQFKKILATRTMDRVECPSDRSAEFVELLNWMLAPDPSSRKSCVECESAPWIQLYSNPELEKSLKHASSLKVDKLDIDYSTVTTIDSGDLEDTIAEIIMHNGHEWRSKYLTKPTWCPFCKSFIWGVTKEMQNCMKCNLCWTSAHRNCCLENSAVCEPIAHKVKTNKWSILKKGTSMTDIAMSVIGKHGQTSLDDIPESNKDDVFQVYNSRHIVQ